MRPPFAFPGLGGHVTSTAMRRFGTGSPPRSGGVLPKATWRLCRVSCASRRSTQERNMTRPHYLLFLALAIAPIAQANDFPTRARVEFVLNCMRESKAPQQESMYKCSCAIDAIAEKVDYSTWVDLSTVANATTIAGERGGVMRDLKDGRKQIASYREMQESAKKSCFIVN